jgi:hypothetical protein
MWRVANRRPVRVEREKNAHANGSHFVIRKIVPVRFFGVRFTRAVIRCGTL